ncbi:MAG: DUF167 family protein [Phycisphaerales bacterium]|jgi:hypothetical protein|nr:DUF167 family protein [Phycisphaerales bacterium]
MTAVNAAMTSDGPDTMLRVKVVPGARRDAVAGMLGDRLKIRVTAPPEAGKANAAVCRLVTAATDRAATVVRGHAHPHKTVRVSGMSPEAVASALGL